MDKGIKVSDYDLINLQRWSEEGVGGLKKSVPDKEFRFYKENTYNLNDLTIEIRAVISHKNFTYHQMRPIFPDLVSALKLGNVCEVVLNPEILDRKKGFSLHRVVILGLDSHEIIFHDPRETPRPARRESISLFKKAWLKATEDPELCIYSRQ